MWLENFPKKVPFWYTPKQILVVSKSDSQKKKKKKKKKVLCLFSYLSPFNFKFSSTIFYLFPLHFPFLPSMPLCSLSSSFSPSIPFSPLPSFPPSFKNFLQPFQGWVPSYACVRMVSMSFHSECLNFYLMRTASNSGGKSLESPYTGKCHMPKPVFIYDASQISGVARGGRGATTHLAKTLPPFPPQNEITLCTEVYWELPFWFPVSPPPTHPWAPLAAPSIWKVWLRPCQGCKHEMTQKGYRGKLGNGERRGMANRAISCRRGKRH